MSQTQNRFNPDRSQYSTINYFDVMEGENSVVFRNITMTIQSDFWVSLEEMR